MGATASTQPLAPRVASPTTASAARRRGFLASRTPPTARTLGLSSRSCRSRRATTGSAMSRVTCAYAPLGMRAWAARTRTTNAPPLKREPSAGRAPTAFTRAAVLVGCASSARAARSSQSSTCFPRSSVHCPLSSFSTGTHAPASGVVVLLRVVLLLLLLLLMLRLPCHGFVAR